MGKNPAVRPGAGFHRDKRLKRKWKRSQDKARLRKKWAHNKGDKECRPN